MHKSDAVATTASHHKPYQYLLNSWTTNKNMLLYDKTWQQCSDCKMHDNKNILTDASCTTTCKQLIHAAAKQLRINKFPSLTA